MPPIKLHKIESIEDLQLYGSYRQLKKFLHIIFGFDIESKDTHDLFLIIKTMKKAVLTQSKQWQDLAQNEANIKKLGKFNSVKKQLSTELGIKISARSWQQLSSRLTSIITAFIPDDTNTHNLSFNAKVAYYEKSKVKNFIDSSKLEGLTITNHSLKVEELVKKYTQPRSTTDITSNG